MKFPGFIGPAYKLDSTSVDNQRAVNIIPETIESGRGKGSQVAYYFNSPGLNKVGSTQTAQVRATWEDEKNRTLAVVGSKIYRVTKTSDWYLNFQTVRDSAFTLPAGAFDAPTDVITISAANSDSFHTGSKVVFASGVSGTGLSVATLYYAIKVTNTTLKLATSMANAIAGTPVVDITNANSGDVEIGFCDLDLTVTNGQSLFQKYSYDEITYLSHINFDTDTITKTDHGLYDGEAFCVSAFGHPLPTGLSANTLYYAIRIDDDNFQIASSLSNAVAGTQIDISMPTASEAPWNVSKLSNFSNFEGYLVNGGSQSESDFELSSSTGPVEASTQLATIERNQVFSVAGISGTTTRQTYVSHIVDGTQNKWLYYYDPIARTTDDEKRDQNPLGSTGTFATPTTDIVSTHAAWIDGYTIFNNINTDDFYVSLLNTLSPSFTGFASSEGSSDNILAHIAFQRSLYIFNERTTEVFVNTGNADFPFERVQGGFIEIGIAAKYSLKRLNNTIFFLGRTQFGDGIVYALAGNQPRRISTHAIERAIASYADISSATAYCYQKNGHGYYVINFAEATWTFDLATGLWHERAYTNSGTLERHRADVVAYSSTHKVHFAGDYANGKIYTLDDEYYSDDGDAITRMRVLPYVSGQKLERFFCSRFQLDMEVGVGLDGDVQGSEPTVMLDYSDDGGRTWSSESWALADGNAGGIGEYETRVQWRRLGRFRSRIFRVKMTDPVKCNWIAAHIDLQGGAS